ncbi:hypothetical protein DFP72DRAFT_42965 [Ephemerocybe angulata]|uniref:Uncharacterized protein n=1 Tax=Ephemerocybe angulata TaxID=980116 RepID=A0A8H6HF50_9AGAR|nr:hypothetical protein DFP72DRAFT_42965 [Tulosesus angulatus]
MYRENPAAICKSTSATCICVQAKILGQTPSARFPNIPVPKRDAECSRRGGICACEPRGSTGAEETKDSTTTHTTAHDHQNRRRQPLPPATRNDGHPVSCARRRTHYPRDLQCPRPLKSAKSKAARKVSSTPATNAHRHFNLPRESRSPNGWGEYGVPTCMSPRRRDCENKATNGTTTSRHTESSIYRSDTIQTNPRRAKQRPRSIESRHLPTKRLTTLKKSGLAEQLNE